MLRGFLVLVAALLINGAALADPLPSWTDGEAKTDIVAFVEAGMVFAAAAIDAAGLKDWWGSPTGSCDWLTLYD